MISARGNRSKVVAAGLCFTTAAFLLSSLMSEKRMKIRLYEKKYTQTVSELETQNYKLKQVIEKE